MKKLSFVIPCYNSSGTLTFVVAEIKEILGKLSDYDYEIILVNDASPDMGKTMNVIRDICSCDKKIKAINLAKNFGQHSAMMAGYAVATGDIVIDLDDDGQLPVDALPEMLNKINDGYDIVVGDFVEKNDSFFRSFGTSINDAMSNVLINKPKDIHFTSFVVMRRFVVEEILRYKNAYPYLAGLMLRASDKIINVPISKRDRVSGKSGYSFSKLLKLWLNGFTAFSVKPLRMATLTGILFAFIGFLYVIYIVIHKINNPQVALGWSSMMATQLIIGGIILFMLGMIGEYIGRIYISINNSPQYVIRETINLEEGKDE